MLGGEGGEGREGCDRRPRPLTHRRKSGTVPLTCMHAHSLLHERQELWVQPMSEKEVQKQEQDGKKVCETTLIWKKICEAFSEGSATFFFLVLVVLKVTGTTFSKNIHLAPTCC